MSKIITICQNKGGVGKTTITANLAYLFAEKKKVLLIDTDSQANLSQYFNVYEKELILEKYFNSELGPVQINKNISIIPNNISFDKWKHQSITIKNSDYFLKSYLQKIKDNYDFILIDTPPSLDISLEMSILCSDYILIITDTGIFTLEGLENVIERIEEIKKNDITNDCKAEVLGVIINQFDNTKISKELYEVLTKNYNVFKSKISKNVAIKESQAVKKSIFDYDKNCQASKDLKVLFKEIKGSLND